ncbi:hypothetical protein [Pseudomonas fontis]|uniref:Uncharacterized protein n=1 Tax=Pseudomonas fontis TaxID=2942633 RepID=A0ABT5NWS6_9PSED|nr:hypothetical protein [Pseudomonas fontis]MDD0975899.1 hypothetical protein [Pseudomonas fontis]MDD0992571.1 hypothetical protein [Pseudomonas fontis]
MAHQTNKDDKTMNSPTPLLDANEPLKWLTALRRALNSQARIPDAKTPTRVTGVGVLCSAGVARAA